MFIPLARSAALLAAGFLAAAAHAQAPAPPATLTVTQARGDARQDTQVALEVRLVSVSEQFFERIGVDFNVNTAGEKATQTCPYPGNPTQFHPAGFVNDFTPEKFLSGPAPAGPCPRDLATPVRGSSSGPVFLSDKQVYLFLEAAQGDQRTNVMQAPKVTVLDGQMAHVDCTDKQFFVTGLELMKCDGQPALVPKNEEVSLGFRMSACPKVSADGRSVRIKLDINQTGLASTVVPLFPVTMQVPGVKDKPVMFTQFLQQPVVKTMHIENTVTVPDGGTVLFGGLKKVSEGPAEFGPPVLSKVPYMNRLFKNTGMARETQAVYVLVTPRIIVDQGEEPRQTGVSRSDAPCCPVSCFGGLDPRVRQTGVTRLDAPCCTPATKATVEECEAVAPPSHGQVKVVAELLKAYDEACAAGRTQEAAKLAQAALILDPTCFAKSRGR